MLSTFYGLVGYTYFHWYRTLSNNDSLSPYSKVVQRKYFIRHYQAYVNWTTATTYYWGNWNRDSGTRTITIVFLPRLRKRPKENMAGEQPEILAVNKPRTAGKTLFIPRCNWIVYLILKGKIHHFIYRYPILMQRGIIEESKAYLPTLLHFLVT